MCAKSFVEWFAEEEQVSESSLKDLLTVPQKKKHHPEGNVFRHTMMVRGSLNSAIELIKSNQQKNNTGPLSNLDLTFSQEDINILKFAGLLHDIGKGESLDPVTLSTHGHENPKTFEIAMKKLGPLWHKMYEKSNLKDKEDLWWIIKYHMSLKKEGFLNKKLRKELLDNEGKYKNDRKVKLLLVLLLMDRMGRGDTGKVSLSQARQFAKNNKTAAEEGLKSIYATADSYLKDLSKTKNTSKPSPDNPKDFIDFLKKSNRTNDQIKQALKGKFGMTPDEIFNLLGESKFNNEKAYVSFLEWSKNKIKIATAFSGIGTVEAGVGAKSVYAAEYDPKTVDHFNLSHGTKHTPKDATNLSSKEIKNSGAALFHASPVCKNFSCAKTWRGADKNDKSSADSISKIIIQAKPPAVSIENVPGYIKTALFKKITNALDMANYTWDVNIVNAADYGGFQNRTRMILRAILNGPLPPLPLKTKPGDWYKAIKDLIPTAEPSKLGKEEKKRINKMIKLGYLNPKKPIITMGGSGFKGTWAAANSGGPSPTLKATQKEVPRIIMPNGKVLRVTPRMMARIAGLPDSMPVPEHHGTAKQYIGNGVDVTISKLFLEPLARKANGNLIT